MHDIDRQGIRREKPVEQPKKEKKIVQNVAPAGETIIVNANDRLGTKVSIPCLASDPISTIINCNILWRGHVAHY